VLGKEKKAQAKNGHPPPERASQPGTLSMSLAGLALRVSETRNDGVSPLHLLVSCTLACMQGFDGSFFFLLIVFFLPFVSNVLSFAGKEIRLGSTEMRLSCWTHSWASEVGGSHACLCNYMCMCLR
jgi:hypothetical protein